MRITKCDHSNKILMWNNERSGCLSRQHRNIAQRDACKIGGQGKRGEKLRDLKVCG